MKRKAEDYIRKAEDYIRKAEDYIKQILQKWRKAEDYIKPEKRKITSNSFFSYVE